VSRRGWAAAFHASRSGLPLTRFVHPRDEPASEESTVAPTAAQRSRISRDQRAAAARKRRESGAWC
jgi:hypothetical protein